MSTKKTDAADDVETNDTNSKITEKEKLEIVLKLIERFDESRNSIANRIAITLSAYSILLTGALYLLNQTLSITKNLTISEKTLLAIFIGFTIFFIVYSMAYSTSGIASVWKLNRDRLSLFPQRPFTNPGDTAKMFSGFEPFSESFYSANWSNLLESALSDLWAGINSQNLRYQVLRKSIQLLILSVVLLTVTTITAIIIGAM